MTDTNKMKTRIKVTQEQKLAFAKLMVDDGYSVLQIMEISGACESAISRWKRQYIFTLEATVYE